VIFVLKKYPSYTTKSGVELEQNKPVDLSDDEAIRLIELGYGTTLYQESVKFDEEGFDLYVGTVPNKPKNTIQEDDDLNGKTVLLRRGGGAIGDAVFVGSVAEAIRSLWPEAHIIMAVRGENDHLNMIPLVTMFSAVDEVISYREGCSFKQISKCDYVIDFNNTIEHNPDSEHMDYYRLQFDRAGMSWFEGFKPVKFRFDGVVSAQYRDWLYGNSLAEGKYVVACVGGSNLLKKYPTRHWKLIAESVASVEGVSCVLLGGPRDRMPSTQHPHVCFAFGVPLQLATRILAGAKAVVVGDTGMLHIAGNLGVPTCSIWGFTSPKNSVPNYEYAVTVESTEPCSPCYLTRASWCHKTQGGYAGCMRAISPVSVLDALKELDVQSEQYVPSVVKDTREQPELRAGRDEIVLNGSENNILVIMENAGTYSGGNYYMYSMARALAECSNTKVWVYCNVKPINHRDYPPHERMRIVVDDNFANFEKLLPPNFDIVIGSPHTPGCMAIDYAQKYGAKSALFVFETPNYIRELREGIDGEDSFWEDYRKALLCADQVIAISKITKAKLEEWEPRLTKDKKFISVFQPCVNEFAANKVPKQERENSIAVISRGVWYKGVPEALAAVQELGCDPPKVYLIGDRISDMRSKFTDTGLDIEILENATDEQKFTILKRVKALLFLSDFEGFGIPPAEALMVGTPVICKPLEVLRNTYGQCAYFPEKGKLARTLATLLNKDLSDKESSRYITFARRAFSWKRMVRKARLLMKRLGTGKTIESIVVSGEDLRVGMVSSWNTYCGIAENTKYFVDELGMPVTIFAPTDDAKRKGDDDSNVIRCWNRQFQNMAPLLEAVLSHGIQVLHIQHEFSFFHNESSLFKFINMCRSKGIRVIVTVHTYRPDVRMFNDLAQVTDVVTSPKCDLDNMTMIPLPIPQWPDVSKTEARLGTGLPEDAVVIGMFGFWQAHKGYKEVIEALPELNMRLSGEGGAKLVIQGQYDRKHSYATDCRRWAMKEGLNDSLLLHGDYTELEVCVRRLQACDLLLFNYLIQGYWSSSAAIRTAMSTHRPVLCSRCLMFQELEDGTHVAKFDYDDRDSMINKVIEVARDGDLAQKLVSGADAYIEQCSPKRIARKYEALYKRVAEGEY